jgi:CRISPR-associated protein Cmr6
MANPAVPRYLGQTFNDAPPGHRFTLYGAFWEPEQGWQRVKNISPADLKKDFGPLTPQSAKLRNALRARQAHVAAALGEAVWTIEAQSIAPFVTGTGIEHPLENGMAFLNPYGLPYLPASGVKGVVRRAAEELRDNVFDEGTQGWNQPAIDLLFGKETKPGDTETVRNRGALIFWDVFPQCDRLAVDIMNPHYGDYYQGNTPPTDSGQPIPIFFLTVPQNSQFTFHVQCDRSRLPGDWPADRWRSLLEAAFSHAFDWLGFGAKTAVGYGAMRQRPELSTTPHPKSSAPDNAQKTAPAVDAIKDNATTALETDPQRWENVALSWNKGKRELNSASVRGNAFAGGAEGASLREKLSVEQRSKLDKGKPITATLTVERIGGNNWQITDIA